MDDRQVPNPARAHASTARCWRRCWFHVREIVEKTIMARNLIAGPDKGQAALVVEVHRCPGRFCLVGNAQRGRLQLRLAETGPLSGAGRRYEWSFAASTDESSRRSFAPSPFQALPCMQASVVGCSDASRSSVADVFGECAK